MKKLFFSIFCIMLVWGGSVFASIEVPEYIKIKMNDGSILEVELDEYLYGVVQSEMGVNYKAEDMDASEPVPLEALKAQAVASRSYAVYKILKAGEDADYHVTSNTSSQVYKDIEPAESIRQAVDETSGQIITYDDDVACAYFFSTSGGHTESPENVWSSEVDYLQAVEDPYEIEVKNKTTWTATYTANEIEKKFPEIGKLEEIQIIETSESGRVIELEIVGSKANKTLLKNGIRTAFGSNKLRSQWFELEQDGDNYIFTGRGYGHGVGMSQNGAIGMGIYGFSYDEILKWYYTDIEILGYDEKYEDEKIIIDDEDREENGGTNEVETPLLDELLAICNTNWVLYYVQEING